MSYHLKTASCSKCEEWRVEGPVTQVYSSAESDRDQRDAAAPDQLKVVCVRFIMMFDISVKPFINAALLALFPSTL